MSEEQFYMGRVSELEKRVADLEKDLNSAHANVDFLVKVANSLQGGLTHIANSSMSNDETKAFIKEVMYGKNLIKP